MNIIAIDCGASFLKCSLFKDEQLITNTQIVAPQKADKNDIFCPDKIESLISLVKVYIEKASEGLDEGVICIDNEMHGFILANEDGSPYTDYISWQTELMDTDELLSYMHEHIGKSLTEDIIMRTGMPLRSGLPSSMLFWLKKEGKLQCGRKLYFYTLGDYIIKRLTGKEPICHPTNAAATGLYDLEASDWNRDYISILTNGSTIVFPKIGNDSISFFINESKTFRVLPALGDQQAALLGSGLKDEQALSINMGTGAQVSRMLMNHPVYGNYQIRPYFFGSYIKTIPHIPSGRAFNVYFRFIKNVLKAFDSDIDDETIWNTIQKIASKKSLDKTNLLCDLSFFENAITSNKNGTISNIGENNLTIENLLGSAFRQMIDNFVYVAGKVNQDLPNYNTIIFSGGFAKRWKIIRDGITKGLASGAEVVLSENDTLFGCMKYAMMYHSEKLYKCGEN